MTHIDICGEMAPLVASGIITAAKEEQQMKHSFRRLLSRWQLCWVRTNVQTTPITFGNFLNNRSFVPGANRK